MHHSAAALIVLQHELVCPDDSAAHEHALSESGADCQVTPWLSMKRVPAAGLSLLDAVSSMDNAVYRVTL